MSISSESVETSGRDVAVLMRKVGLVRTKPSWLSISRRRAGKTNKYFKADGAPISDRGVVERLNKLAVPPAYSEVKYASQAAAHLQAIGRDDAGRLQYRYHPDWERVREERKRARLSRIIDALPLLKTALARHLKAEETDRNFAVAACVELVLSTAIRAGGQRYEASSGNRGATTLRKTNLQIAGDTLSLAFRGKGGKQIAQTIKQKRLVAAIKRLKTIPGKYLLQYRDAEGGVHKLRAADVNAYLKSVTGVAISLKDFRTLWGSQIVTAELAALQPAEKPTVRKRQIRGAVERAAELLANTPAVCLKSYVHDCVVEAFESGRLQRLHKTANAPQRAGLTLLAKVLRGRGVAL